MKTLEQLHEDLESARGGMNVGDIEDAVYAIAEYEARVMREGLLRIVREYDSAPDSCDERFRRSAEIARGILEKINGQ